MPSSPKWPVYQIASSDGTVAVGKSPRYPVIQIADSSGNLTSLAGVGVYNVQDYGAKGDGVTDDTSAIQTAINTAVTNCQSDGSYLAQVFLPAGKYKLAGSLVQGGATKGNALLTLPVIPTTSHKVTLMLKGPGPVSPVAHWEQTVGQRAGAVLSTTVAGTQDGTFGEASVVGGPTPAQGYGQATVVFNNMCIVVDGIGISVPNDPAICGFDFRGMAECIVEDASVLVNSAPASISAPSGAHQWTFGLAMPEGGNNDLCDVNRFSCEGLCYGILVAEHANIESVRCVYTIGAIMVSQAGGHGIKIKYASVEQSQMAVGVLQGVNGSPIDIDQLDYEFPSQSGFGYFVLINDSGNRLFGTINVVWAGGNLSNSRTMMTGGANLRLLDAQYGFGHVASPSIPTSATDFLNPFWRPAAVTITGGTVSAIAVDGTATGLTSGTVVLPSGKNIKLTYTVAPSWTWCLI